MDEVMRRRQVEKWRDGRNGEMEEMERWRNGEVTSGGKENLS